MPQPSLRLVFTPEDAAELAARAAVHPAVHIADPEAPLVGYIDRGHYTNPPAPRRQYRRARTRAGRTIQRVWRALTHWAPWTIAAGLILGAAIYGATPARADGILTDAEYAYVLTWGPTAVCPVLDQFPTANGVFGVVRGITEDGFSPDNAVDIVNESVYDFCPRHWQMLVAIGQAARAATQGQVA